MEKFLNLLTDELKRSYKTFLIIFTSFIILQTSVLVFNAYQISTAEFGVEAYTFMLKDLYETNSLMSLLLGGYLVLFIIYAIYTWAGEWSREDRYILRLLSLPGNRVSIAYSKLLSIIIMVVLMFIGQIIMFNVADLIGAKIIPNYAAYPWQYYTLNKQMIPMLSFPVDWQEFIVLYGLPVSYLVSLFNFMIILMSRRAYGNTQTGLRLFLNVFVQLLTTYLMHYIPNLMAAGAGAQYTMLGLIIGQLVYNLALMHYLMEKYISI